MTLVNDLITNNGLIRNSNYQLYVNVYGDIVNNGDWINTTITTKGTSGQFISCENGNSFGVINFNDSDNSSKIVSAGKVSFSGTNPDLSDGRLDCAANELEFINNARSPNKTKFINERWELKGFCKKFCKSLYLCFNFASGSCKPKSIGCPSL